MPEKDLKLAQEITGQWMDYFLSPQNTSSFAFDANKDPCIVARDPAVLGQTKEVWLACRTDSQPGLGTESDPFDVSTAQQFDAKMAAFCNQGAGGNIVIHLRPGTYMTNGWVYLAKGTHLIGAGIGRTIIKLNHFNDAANNPETTSGENLKQVFDTYIDDVHPEYTHHLLIANLSIDCDAPNQGNGWYFQAIRLKGNYSRVSNVEILQMGNRCKGVIVEGQVFRVENFPVSIGNPDPDAPLYGAVIERVFYHGTMAVPGDEQTSQTTFCMITNRNFLLVPDAASIDVSATPGTLVFPATGNIIYIVDNGGSSPAVSISAVSGVRPGVEYVIINARTSTTPSFTIVGGSATIFGATQTLPSAEAAPGAIKVIGISPVKGGGP